ncbi:hypothetical protein [Arenimonas composti]|uniref:Uncharacterized protein n=1 Tax=Arenimonas composti TR7-09 = DSM 18010 TaxID=1121013 RepID=A0A091BGF9_9GAMM|nr:hypothetical protein [Arenimonas composti]KFN50836.1 hypothetical protein P873_00380 [Arenimonas composti TR7-09 = DSM 18010]
MKSLKYWWAAFNARPFGMPIPPNWFGIAAFAMLGGFVNPGFWIVGAALEITYLSSLAGSKRFRNAIDVGERREDPADARYLAMTERLDGRQRERQSSLEARAREILRTLDGSPMLAAYSDHLQQLVWLHLRLLNARQAIERVLATARREADALDEQERQLRRRLEEPNLSPDLRRSLEQQVAVIDQRQAAHADAAERGEHVDSELQRIDLQVALIREQALLSRDRNDLGGSLDALAASFNEASRWLDSQRDLIGTLDSPLEQRLPARVLRGEAPPRKAAREGE